MLYTAFQLNSCSFIGFRLWGGGGVKDMWHGGEEAQVAEMNNKLSSSSSSDNTRRKKHPLIGSCGALHIYLPHVLVKIYFGDIEIYIYIYMCIYIHTKYIHTCKQRATHRSTCLLYTRKRQNFPSFRTHMPRTESERLPTKP